MILKINNNNINNNSKKDDYRKSRLSLKKFHSNIFNIINKYNNKLYYIYIYILNYILYFILFFIRKKKLDLITIFHELYKIFQLI